MHGIPQSSVAWMEFLAAVPKPDTLLKIFDRLGPALSVMVRKKDGF